MSQSKTQVLKKLFQKGMATCFHDWLAGCSLSPSLPTWLADLPCSRGLQFASLPLSPCVAILCLRESKHRHQGAVNSERESSTSMCASTPPAENEVCGKLSHRRRQKETPTIRVRGRRRLRRLGGHEQEAGKGEALRCR